MTLECLLNKTCEFGGMFFVEIMTNNTSFDFDKSILITQDKISFAINNFPIKSVVQIETFDDGKTWAISQTLLKNNKQPTIKEILKMKFLFQSMNLENFDTSPFSNLVFFVEENNPLEITCSERPKKRAI